MKISIRDLMAQSGVAFGTSGARGLVTAMTDRVCYAYTRGFLQYLEVIDVTAGHWFVRGSSQASGTEATPFSATV